jgi:hypothetical protein
MLGGSTFPIRQLMLVALIAIAVAPMSRDTATPNQEIARNASDSSGAILLAQRCFTYKGQLKCF